MGISFSKQQRPGNIVVLGIAGNLDMSTVEDLEKKLKEVIDEGAKKIAADLKELEFMSSAGWGALVFSKGKLAEETGNIVLANMNEDVKRAHDIMGLEPMLSSFDNIEDAVNALK